MASETLVTGNRHYVPSDTSSSERFRFDQDASTGKLSVQITRDNGVTWKAIAAEPPSNAGIGWIPTIAEGGSVKWVSPVEVLSYRTSTAYSNQLWVDFNHPASVMPNTTFGILDVPKGINFYAYGMQVSFFKKPTNSFDVFFVDSEERSILNLPSETSPYNIVSSVTYSREMFTEKILIPEGSIVRAKTGNSTESGMGDFMTVRLLLEKI